MNYKVVINASAEKELKKLSAKVQDRIFEKIDSLAQEPRPHGVKKLKEFDLPNLVFDNYYRVRAGDYRIVYSIEDDIITITIVKIGNRKHVYE